MNKVKCRERKSDFTLCSLYCDDCYFSPHECLQFISILRKELHRLRWLTQWSSSYHTGLVTFGHGFNSQPGYFWDSWPSFMGKLSWDITPPRSTQPCILPGLLFSWGKGGKVTTAEWQVTLCDPICDFPQLWGDFDYKLLYPIYLLILRTFKLIQLFRNIIIIYIILKAMQHQPSK